MTEIVPPPEATPPNPPHDDGPPSPRPPDGGSTDEASPDTAGTSLRRRIARRALALDATLDTAVYRVATGAVEGYRRLSVAMRVFRLRGLRRLFVEILDDGLTFGAVGFVAMLALALPAMQVTKVDWRKNVDYSVLFLDRYGNEIGRRGITLDDSVPLEQFPDHLIKALLATEDRRFFDHFGIDVIGTARAVVANLRHRTVVQGGSSLTQQLAKNLFLTNERSIERKIKEAFIALWLEANLSKREILKLYLDRAYMGGGTFGVAAASEFYFGKSVRDIDLAEAAMLAGLFKAPSKYAPHANLPAARARANDVLSNMVAAGFLTEGQVIAARRRPATPVDRQRIYSPDYFLDWAFDEVQEKSPAEHTLVVRTTIDVGLQKKAEEVIENALRQHGEELDVSQAAAVFMDPLGAVRAMVGGRDYSASQFNRATDAARQPGSSFKPYVYLAALLAGKTPTSTIVDQPYCIGNWCPKNYGGSYYGRVTLLEGIARSLNSVPVQLAAQIGRERVAAVARRFGIDLPQKPDWPFVIGASEVHMVDHAGGYAVFANGGFKIEPYAVEEIRSTSGRLLYERSYDGPAPTRIFPADKIAEIDSMLYNAVENGTGQRAKLDGIPAGGKTGTTQSSRDAWFCGFTGNLVGVVWVGNDDYHPMERVTGGMLPAPIWHDVMAYAHQNVELKPAPGMPAPKRGAATVADGAGAARGLGAPTTSPVSGRPKPLSAKSIGVLTEIEKRLDAVSKSLTPPPASNGARTGSLHPPAPAGGRLIRLAESGAASGLVAVNRGDDGRRH